MRKARSQTPARLALGTSLLLGVAALLYAAVAVPLINRTDDVRPFAASVDDAMPPGKPLVIYDPGYLAAIFYLHMPYRYALVPADVSASTEWLLIKAKQWKKMEEKFPNWTVVRNLQCKNFEPFLLLQRSPELQKLPPP